MSEKKVGKRLLTWVLVLVMTLSLLPLNALAAETAPSDVKIGHYDKDSWTEGTLNQSPPEGVDSVSKTATRVGNPEDNTYQVTLEVKMHTTTETQTSYAQAATVLVIDTSGSMGDDGKLTEAKAAAIRFLDSYRKGGGRLVALVCFATDAEDVCGWKNVSSDDGYQTIVNAINSLSADGGTNLHQGLDKAQNLLGDTTLPSEALKSIIALTDGEPTYYNASHDHYWEFIYKGNYPDGNGLSCNDDTFKATKNKAEEIRSNGYSLYSICFAANNEKLSVPKDIAGNNGPKKISLYDYLNTYIAPGKTYSASNLNELNSAFGAISSTITSGLSSGTVHDSLPAGVTSTAIPSGAAEWDLNTFEKTTSTEGNTTTYTYTKSYTVTIDPTKIQVNDGDYYPLNGPTTLTVKGSNNEDVTIDFPIPAGKVTFPEPEKYTLTYDANGGSGAPAAVSNIPATKDYTLDSTTIPTKAADANYTYTFKGWGTSADATTTITTIDIESNTTVYAVWDKHKITKYTVKFESNGGTLVKDQTVKSGEKATKPTNPTRSGYTFNGWYDKDLKAAYDFNTPVTADITLYAKWTYNGGYHPRPTTPTVEIPDDDALGLNTTDHFAYIVGYGNGEVRPQNNITRAEVATIFFRLLTDDVRDENLTRTNRYSDVASADWYNTAVSTLSAMGIITGYPDGTFRPNAAITRAEFAAIAARFDNDGDKTAAKFSDIATHWAKDEISIAYNNGWITGYPDGTFGPQRDITRAETMTLVNRVLNRLPETEEDLLPDMVTWTDNADPNAWYYLAIQEATNSHYYKFKTNSKYEKWTALRENRDWTLLEK